MEHARIITEDREQRLRELIQISIALTAERNLNRLLELILLKARELTQSDAGSLYLVEKYDEDESTALRFQVAQNDSVAFDPPPHTMIPMDETSIAGFVASTGKVVNIPDVYRIDNQYPFSFNPSFDQAIGYRTKSVLAVPLFNTRNEVIGVLQLINRKVKQVPLNTVEAIEKGVIPFSEEDQDLLLALASQAAIAIENNRHMQDIENLFESFIQAAVTAVEQRDPTTSGHSVRVARLSVALAEAVNAENTGPYASVRFTTNHLKELYYAAILHDFGKIGVREHVLVKGKKLYEHEYVAIQNRIAFAIRTLQWLYEKQKVKYLLQHGTTAHDIYFKELDRQLNAEIRQLQLYADTIRRANEPTVLPEGDFRVLQKIARVTYLDLEGRRRPLLHPKEIARLSIRMGTLDVHERAQIENHVTQTFEFLSRIPWTPELRNVPFYAYGHHEKLDGSGYPRGLKGKEIPIQTRIMTIADIFDALAAQDRPYKRAVPPDEAVAIMQEEVEQGKLDPELFRIFRKARLWESIDLPVHDFLDHV